MRANPSVYEINTLIFLRRLSRKYDRPLTLSTVPDQEWRRLSRMGFDMVWLMGVWQRSPASRQEALRIPDLRRAYAEALPDWAENDVMGSPYAILDYKLEPILGNHEELADTKAILNRHNLGLVLDFVPNHLARDHHWTIQHPDRFVQRNDAGLGQHPDWFFASENGKYMAHGKDPYFPPWTDTAQVNFFSADLREAQANELARIANLADGVRCDMAMLALNAVFEQTWGWALDDMQRPETEFWTEAIEAARNANPNVLFVAEAYWGLERELEGVGFDFTYDKALYDKLRSASSEDIREHLKSSDPGRSVHFIENHDEPRAAAAFGRERSRAAAVAISTVPGLRLFHDGQMEGKTARLPVQLGREPEETADLELTGFYERLLSSCKADPFHEGEWIILNLSKAWDGNQSHANLLAWSWQHQNQTRVVVINYSSNSAQGRVHLPSLPNGRTHVELVDELNGITYEREVAELNNIGLYVDLAPWSAHVMAMG